MSDLPYRIWLTAPAPDEIEWTSEKRDDADVMYLRADTLPNWEELVELCKATKIVRSVDFSVGEGADNKLNVNLDYEELADAILARIKGETK